MIDVFHAFIAQDHPLAKKFADLYEQVKQHKPHERTFLTEWKKANPEEAAELTLFVQEFERNFYKDQESK